MAETTPVDDPVVERLTAVIAAVREDAARRHTPLIDSTRWSWDGALRVEGSVLVESQVLAYHRALRAASFADPPRPAVETELRRSPEGLRFRSVDPGARLELFRAPTGEDLQTQWAGPAWVRHFAQEGLRALVQIEDGTVGWVDDHVLGPLTALTADPWATVRRAGEGVSERIDADHHSAPARWARQRLGVPYRWGGNDEQAYDCSGFVQSALRQGIGLLLPKHTTDQMRRGVRVPVGAVAHLDLLFVQGREDRRNHVGLVLDAEGATHVVHACLSRGRVLEESLSAFLDRYRFIGARRVVTWPGGPVAPTRPEPNAGDSQDVERSASQPGPSERGRRWAETLRGGAVHVVGASSAEGSELLLHLVGVHGLADVHGHDFSPDAQAFARSYRKANSGWAKDLREARLNRLRRLPLQLHLGAEYLDGIEGAGTIFASQNWFNYAPNLPRLQAAADRGTPMAGIVDVAMALFPGTRVGVTGSNGKSTTTALVRHLLQHGGTFGRVLQGGNDRDQQVSLLDVESASTHDALVWEVSNRHLRDRGVTVDVAVVTNISANHVGDHGGYDAYREAKARLPRAVPPGGHVVIPGRVAEAHHCGEGLQTGVSRWWTGVRATDPGPWSSDDAFVYECDALLTIAPPGSGPKRTVRIDAFPLPGAHNRENLMAAVAVAAAVGVDVAALEAALLDSPTLAARLERVDAGGAVRVWNDLSSTTPESTIVALQCLGAPGRPLILIVGGEDKGMDFRALAACIRDGGHWVFALPGTGTDALVRSLDSSERLRRFQGADEAIRDALRSALADDTVGGVLLSPGMAFFQSQFLGDGPSVAQRVRAHLTTLTDERSRG